MILARCAGCNASQSQRNRDSCIRALPAYTPFKSPWHMPNSATVLGAALLLLPQICGREPISTCLPAVMPDYQDIKQEGQLVYNPTHLGLQAPESRGTGQRHGGSTGRGPMSLARCDTNCPHTGSICVVTSDWNRAWRSEAETSGRSQRDAEWSSGPKLGEDEKRACPVYIYLPGCYAYEADPFTPSRWR